MCHYGTYKTSDKTLLLTKSFTEIVSSVQKKSENQPTTDRRTSRSIATQIRKTNLADSNTNLGLDELII